MNNELLALIRDELNAGNIKKVFSLFDEHLSTDSENYETYVIIKNRFYDVEKEFNQKLSSPESYSISKNIVLKNLREFIASRLEVNKFKFDEKFQNKDWQESIRIIKTQLSGGDIEQGFQSINYILNKAEKLDANYQNEIAIILNRYYRLKEHEWKGIINRDQAELEKSKLLLIGFQLLEELQDPKEKQDTNSFEKEKNRIEKEIQKEKLKTSASTFVDHSIDQLKLRESSLNRQAIIWYSLGLISLLSGIGVSFYLIVGESIQLNSTPSIIYTVLKGLVIIGLLVATARYSFLLGKTYMNESLKNADRIHAISFGKFYLQVFDTDISKDDLKEVFKDWNTYSDSQFVKLQSSEFDPKYLEALNKFIENVKNLKQ